MEQTGGGGTATGALTRSSGADAAGRIVTLAAGGVIAAALAGGLLAALALPFHHADALVFGRWSRLVELTGDFHFSVLGAIDLQRPFYYVTLGWLWRLTGFHEVVGRLFSLAFALVLLSAVAVLGRRTWGRSGALLAVLFLLAVPDFLRGMPNGLTDVPVAAAVAVAGALVWRVPQTWPVRLGAAVSAAAATLTKPSALLALVGLAAATLIVPRRERARAAASLVPLGAGALAAVGYDALQAGRLHDTLYGFLSAGTTGQWAQLADEVRRSTLLQSAWLGSGLRLPLWFAGTYAVARLLGASHRRSVVAGLPAALVGSWLLPAIDSGRPLGPLASGVTGGSVGYVLFAVAFAAAAFAPEEDAPSRSALARQLVWALPSVAAWADHAVYATRLISPAWPPLVLLLAGVFRPSLSGAAALSRRAAPAPAAILVVVAALALPAIDGLGTDGWHYLLAAKPAGWADSRRMADLALGDFTVEVAEARRTVASGGRLVANDGRLGFYLPRQLDFRLPRTCADLRGHTGFVLLLDTASAAAMEQAHRGASRIGYWSSCRRPSVRLVRTVPGEFAVFSLGG